MKKQNNLHEISVFAFNDNSKTVEEMIYKYHRYKVKKERFRWLLAFLFTLSILLGVIEGDRRYIIQFEIYQKVYRDRANKKINLLVEDLKYAVYNKEMGVR